MTHVVLSIPAILIAAIMVGIPLNWLLGGTRSGLQRIAIALVSVPATVVLAVALFTFNALVPETYAALLRFADWIWQASLNALSARGDTIPGAIKLTNIARQGFSGHHYVIMALCSVVASFLVNALFGAVDDALQPVLGWHPTLTEYEIKAVSAGEDAQGQVLVRCRRSSDEGPGALVVTGHGLSTNIIEASLEGYLVAVNKLHGAEINGVEVAFVTPRTEEGLR